MFCDEIIEKAYLGQPRYDADGESYLDCYYDMTLHLTEGYREILETEHYYISIQHDGVFLLDKLGLVSTIEKPEEWIDSHWHEEEDGDPDDAAWIDYEWTLFVGEKLTAVREEKNGWSLLFTDFTLKLVGHEIDSYDRWYEPPRAYSKVLGTERLIKPCTCGGKGVLVLDIVGDYGIRCEKCHRGTSANPCACGAIQEWNEVRDLFNIGDYPEETFMKHCREPIDYIAVDRSCILENINFVECDSIIVAMGGRIYNISWRYAGSGEYDFAFEEYDSFSPEMWPRRIIATEQEPIRFARKENAHAATLRFYIGSRPILVTASMRSLFVGISHEDENGEWLSFDNNALFNDAVT